MSQTKWLVAALVPGVERQPLKKFDAQEEILLKLLHRWRREAGKAGRNIKRIGVAFEAGRDGFWLQRIPVILKHSLRERNSWRIRLGLVVG